MREYFIDYFAACPHQTYAGSSVDRKMTAKSAGELVDESRCDLDVDWQTALSRAIRSLDQLLERLNLPLEMANTPVGSGAGTATDAQSDFPVFVPLEFIQRIQPGDPADPLLLQVLPQAAETQSPDGFVNDPVGDLDAALESGAIQKYRGRALLIATGVCAVHCRYCFRRHYPYESAPKGMEAWQPAIDQVTADLDIDEVILSGGDPLMMTDHAIRRLVEKIEAIPHVRRLRIHTRLPIMIPQRITTELVDLLRQTRLVPILVIHANHPAELNCEAVRSAINRLVDAGVPVLNQSVLLRGVNDSTQTLVSLSRELVNLRVMPYYLHQLDRVVGAAHFEVPKSIGIQIIEEMRSILPGYAVPRFAEEVAGEPGKSIIA